MFTDVVLPGRVSGRVIAREATSRRSALKVLFASGFPGVLLAGAGGVASGAALLGKPYRLARRIRDALDH